MTIPTGITRSLTALTLLTALKLLTALTLLTAPAGGQEAEPPPRVLATVDGRAITSRQVSRQVERVVRGREVTELARRRLSETALEQLISRELILSSLDAQKTAATPEDIELELARIGKRLAVENRTLEQYLKNSGLTLDEMRQTLRWQLSWERHLRKYLTDENLQRYFQSHRPQFDGSRMSVSHILIQADPLDEQAVAAARRRALEIRGAIDEGLDFAAAARQHSQAPTGRDGGSVGEITMSGPMHAAFTRAAFELDEGEVSEPVTTPFGAHLIRCDKIMSGTRGWKDARGELEQAMAAYLFQWVADRQRGKSRIERSPASGAALSSDSPTSPNSPN